MVKNKKMYILFLILTIISIIIPNTSNAAQKKYYDYTIERYNINMTVNEDNTFDITEIITTNFNVSKHGIFRKIPLKNEVKRLDGTKSNNKAQITNIDVVGDDYNTYNEDGYKVIKIGNAYNTIKGNHTYTIKYTYNIGKDPLKNKDELYFNLIGEEWDAPIKRISFNIKMPKEFDGTLLGFSSGKVGSTYNSNVSYSVNGKVITGRVNGTLNPGEALTVRLELPDKYFVGAGHKVDSFSTFTIVLCVIFVVMAYTMKYKYGKSEQIIETVEFYPPEGYNSAEIGYLYSGKAENKGVISLLIYLANKGYLKIEDTGENEAFDEDEKIMKIIKLKEYDGDNDNEKEFFNGLFSMSGSILEKAENIQDQEELKGNDITWEEAKKRAKEDTRTYVTTLELEGNLYTTVSNIEENIEKEYKDKIIDKTTKGKRKWLVFMIIAIMLLITINPMIKYSGGEGLMYGEGTIVMIPFALIFPGIGFTVLLSMLLGKNPIPVKIFGLIWGLGFGGIPWAIMVLPCLLENSIYLTTYGIGVVCIAVLIIFFNNMKPKRTEFGKQMLGKLTGFKRFLETAEKEQLESLVMKEPEYFYNILPYTYALGVSDKWMSRFESIAMQQPNWYNSNGGFDFNTFSKSMETISSIRTSSSTSSSGGSSGGSSSGGGSSGGGSGGGGGGSW